MTSTCRYEIPKQIVGSPIRSSDDLRTLASVKQRGVLPYLKSSNPRKVIALGIYLINFHYKAIASSSIKSSSRALAALSQAIDALLTIPHLTKLRNFIKQRFKQGNVMRQHIQSNHISE